MQSIEPRPKRGRPRIFPDRVLSNAECVRRWRAKHPPPPKPPPEEGAPLQLRTFGEIAELLLEKPEKPEKPPARPPFDVEALIA
jgi:hypothetical protein